MSIISTRVFARFKKSAPPEERSYIERLENSPLVGRFLAEVDDSILSARAEKVAHYRGTLQRHEPVMLAANKAHAAAVKAREQAERALADARTKEMMAMQATFSASGSYDRELWTLRLQLEQDADPRVAELELWLLKCERYANAAADFAVDSQTGAVINNDKEVNAARAAVREAIEMCLAMKVQALSPVDTEARLLAAIELVRAPLEAVGLRAPRLVAGEVLAPLPFGIREDLLAATTR